MKKTDQRGHTQARIGSERCRRYKREAREVLAFRANHLNVLFSLLSVIFFCGCAAFFADCFYRALSMSDISLPNEQLLYSVFRISSVAILFLMLSPLYAGLITYLVDVYHTRSANVGYVPQTGLFCFYASVETAVRAWMITFTRLIGIALFPLAAQLVFLFGKYVLTFLGKHNPVGAAIGIFVLFAFAFCLLCAVLVIDLFFKTFVIYAVMHPTNSVFSCLCASANHMKHHAKVGLMLLFQFIPWVLVSVMSVGVLFFLYVLPYILFSEISYSVHLMMEAKEP